MIGSTHLLVFKKHSNKFDIITTINVFLLDFFQDCVLRNLLLKVKDTAKNVVSIISLQNFSQEYYHNLELSSGGAA